MHPRMTTIHLGAMVAIACGIAAAAGPAATAEEAASGKDRNLVRALDDLLRTQGGPPGVIVVIQRGDKRSVYRAGTADRDCPDDCPAKPRDYQRIASVAKAFSGAVALGLVAEGRLSLDDTIGDRLPFLPVGWHAVKLQQLLNHTSGVPDIADSEAFFKRVSRKPADPPSPRRIIKYVADLPLAFPPGSKYQYSNSDNIIVGLMVEAATGASYAEELARVVTKPTGLKRTFMPTGVDLPDPFIRGYAIDKGQYEDVSEVIAFGGYGWASGGIVSTPQDLSTFVRAYVSGKFGGKVERAAQFAFIKGGESGPPGPGANSAGLALFRYRTRCGTIYGHTGNILGYTHFIAATADGQNSVVFSINTQVTDAILPALRAAEETAVCVALGGSD